LRQSAGAVIAAACRTLFCGLALLAKFNIRTTIISPGAVASELSGSITEPEDVDINEILFRPTRQEYEKLRRR
jgi:NADP-dependent 3-hydroxy acid dehydrogenase YdfG